MGKRHAITFWSFASMVGSADHRAIIERQLRRPMARPEHARNVKDVLHPLVLGVCDSLTTERGGSGNVQALENKQCSRFKVTREAHELVESMSNLDSAPMSRTYD